MSNVTRFRVEVTPTLVYFVDSFSFDEACVDAVDLYKRGAKTAYECEPQATAEACADQ